METSDSAVTAGLIALALALVEIVKGMVTKLNTRKTSNAPPPAACPDAMQIHVKKIYSTMTRTDQDGTPLIYVPRSLATLLQKNLDAVQSNQQTSKAVLKAIERIEAKR